MSTSLSFEASEYRADGSLQMVTYCFMGDESRGWSVLRENLPVLSLGPGFVPIRTLACGVCSTDLARRFLPYPLPQIIGHEVVGQLNGQQVVVEINASHHARGWQEADCPFCSSGLDSQCPHRLTLGIDRLPGGFSPWILAPRKAIIPIPSGIGPYAAALTEPLAATLQAVEATWPGNGDRVAVLGPRRLGLLMIVALAGFRRQRDLNFSITALGRHSELLQKALRLGADHSLNLTEPNEDTFDLVFDTTGSVSGFMLALEKATRVVHLKSTHGQAVSGMNHLSDLVVDELALLPLREKGFFLHWPIEGRSRPRRRVLVLPEVNLATLPPGPIYHQLSLEQAVRFIFDFPWEKGDLPRFDLAVVSNLAQADAVIRPAADWSHSLVRPRGAILVANQKNCQSPLSRALARGLEIHSSRCGSFRRALDILAGSPQLATLLEREMITHHFPLSEINQAFATAGNSGLSIKVLVETGLTS